LQSLVQEDLGHGESLSPEVATVDCEDLDDCDDPAGDGDDQVEDFEELTNFINRGITKAEVSCKLVYLKVLQY
jgi:hypothetical protein